MTWSLVAKNRSLGLRLPAGSRGRRKAGEASDGDIDTRFRPHRFGKAAGPEPGARLRREAGDVQVVVRRVDVLAGLAAQVCAIALLGAVHDAVAAPARAAARHVEAGGVAAETARVEALQL